MAGAVMDLHCTLTVINSAESTVTLHWTAISDPPGAVFGPRSGTLAPGQTSPMIDVEAGTRCPIVFVLRDERQGKEIRSAYDAC